MFDEVEEEHERPEYRASVVRILECTPGNIDVPDGRKAVVMTIARGDEIEPLVFPIRDAKVIVARMLVALATYDDDFASKLLDDHFHTDNNDEFIWPPGAPPS